MNVWATEVQMVSALAFTPDGRAMAVIGQDGSGLFSVPDGAKLAPLPNSASRRVWYSEGRLLSQDSDFTVLDSGGSTLPALPEDVSQVIAADDTARTLITTATRVRNVPADGRRRTRRHAPPERSVNVSVFRRIDQSATGWVERWRVELVGYRADVGALSADGRWLAVGSRWGTDAQVWDAGSGRLVHGLGAEQVVGGRFVGDRLVAFSRSHLFVWDANDWGRPPLLMYGGERERLDALAVHPDGRRAFLTNFARTVLEVDLASGTVRTTMDWGVPLLSRVAVSPDGTLAAAANHGGQVVLWDLDP